MSHDDVQRQIQQQLAEEMQGMSDRMSEMARIAGEHGLQDAELWIGATGVQSSMAADLMRTAEFTP